MADAVTTARASTQAGATSDHSFVWRRRRGQLALRRLSGLLFVAPSVGTSSILFRMRFGAVG